MKWKSGVEKHTEKVKREVIVKETDKVTEWKSCDTSPFRWDHDCECI